MFSSDLLRTSTRKGRIYPQFCNVNDHNTSDETFSEYELATRLISIFEQSQKQQKTKGQLHDIISAMEPDYDYKLVRGFSTLLERRSLFVMKTLASAPDVLPFDLRQILFTESSQAGLATSDVKRTAIVQKTADKLCNVSDAEISDVLWADLDENHILSRFDTIAAQDLLLWYNMSLAQTLLFKCTRLSFYIGGDGLHWKHVLRAVKMRGLMYVLERKISNDTDDAKNTSSNDTTDVCNNAQKPVLLNCIIEGPLSLFKLTTKYGTAFAHLLPIITRTPVWGIDATISKKTAAGDKLYRFEMSDKTVQEKYLRVISNIDSDEQNNYDSLVERKFADILHQHFGQNDKLGWCMKREPEPLLAGNKAMLPDFVFEKFDSRVYLEIMGFWTPDYIKRKIAKIRDILADSVSSNDDSTNAPVDMLVGIDSSLLCSQISEISNMPGVFLFDARHISVKPILDHLKQIDHTLEQNAATNKQIAQNDLLHKDVILLRDLALQYMVPENSIPVMLEKSAPGMYVKAGPYVISTRKASEVSCMFVDCNDMKFVDVCNVMLDAMIPEACHADLLSFLGYDVVWTDLNPANATISKKI